MSRSDRGEFIGVREVEPEYGKPEHGWPSGPARLKRLLLVDDNATNVRLLARLLTRGDIEVVTATDALDAVAKARREDFDVMIVDLLMAPIGGLELLQMTQGLMKQRYVLTGYADASEEKAALALGATAVFHKPVDVAQLLELIRSGT